MGPAVNLDWSLALVNDRFAHASTVAFVALAQTVDTRAMRSAAIGTGGVGAIRPRRRRLMRWRVLLLPSHY
jgi:hypothetical protein